MRLALLLGLLALVVFGAAARIVDWRADSEMRQRFDASLLARAQSLAALVSIQNGHVTVAPDTAATAVLPRDGGPGRYAITCNGAPIAHSAEIPPALTAGREPRFGHARIAAGYTLRIVALRFAPVGQPAASVPDCELRYALDRGPLEQILHTLDFILLGSLLGACLLVVLATPWLARRALRPLTRLDAAMAGIGPDTPGQRLPTTTTAELAPLVTRFNEVLERMDAGLARERQFAAGVAHEFRTRLAELRTLVDVETRYPSGRDAASLLREIGSIGTELEATVTALLQLTRIQSGLEQPDPETVPVAALVARTCARQADAAYARGLRLDAERANATALTIEADPTLLEIVLDNLLGNAIAYTPRGETIRLSADHERLVVSNAAPHLSAGDLANFGQRFWRKGAQDASHAGLGLALAGAAARALDMQLAFALHDGQLRATLAWRGQTRRLAALLRVPDDAVDAPQQHPTRPGNA
jgi:signal transduction histidine kinase